jgi:hypothetical protein
LLRKLLRLAPALILLGMTLTVCPAPHEAGAKTVRVNPPDSAIRKQVKRYQHDTWRWQRLMGVRRTPIRKLAFAGKSQAFKMWVRNLWHRRAVRAWRQASRPPHQRQWRCIQRHEGAWNDPDPPYYGGLQMDISFQRTYGRDLLRRKGTADRWTPLEQMWVAERAFRSGRGFYPWPNTARHCGLI